MCNKPALQGPSPPPGVSVTATVKLEGSQAQNLLLTSASQECIGCLIANQPATDHKDIPGESCPLPLHRPQRLRGGWKP